MIEINLLPEELRNKVVKVAKPKAESNAVGLEPKHFLLIIPLVFVLLISAQLIAGLAAAINYGQLNALNARWNGLQAQRNALAEFNGKYNLLSGDALILQKLTRERVCWSEKLNKLSLYLPSGLWLEELSVSPKELVLKGGAVSLNKEELNLINQFISKLKGDPSFFKDFNTLELGAAQKIKLGTYDVTEFILNATIKAK